jgi:hypothetical protein
MRSSPVIFSLALLSAAGLARAADSSTVAVLSSQGAAYMEAFAAFQAAYGTDVKHFDISKNRLELPDGTKTVVSFGGKASDYPYPPGISVVYCMAPGLILRQNGTAGSSVKISMLPRLGLILSELKAIQPGLKRLRVFWMAPSYGNYMNDLKSKGQLLGIAVEGTRIGSIDELPELLRGSLGTMDAFWLPPDPLLLTPESLTIFREFSWDNGVPYYASSRVQAIEGATASIGTSFSGIGKAAAMAAMALEAGEKQPTVIFLDKAELTLNAAAHLVP